MQDTFKLALSKASIKYIDNDPTEGSAHYSVGWSGYSGAGVYYLKNNQYYAIVGECVLSMVQKSEFEAVFIETEPPSNVSNITESLLLKAISVASHKHSMNELS